MAYRILGLLLAGLAVPALAADFDLIIRHGRVVDGTGNPARLADVAIQGGRIRTVGPVTGSAEREVEARGLMVAPGFIDAHTHAENIDDLPLAENFARMGVTTLVLGNCGSSVRDVAGFFRNLSATNISLNIATLIGHGTVREQAMGGDFDRAPTAAELTRMQAAVEQAMKDGAVGLSTGLIYLPGTFSKTDEIVELARVAGRYDGIYASHMRNEGDAIFDALNELFRVSRQGGLRAHVSHIKLSGRPNWGQADKVLAAIERARSEGLDITQDQYAYTASSTGLATLIPKKYREGGKFMEHYTNLQTRAQIVREIREQRERSGAGDYTYAVIAYCQADHSLNGLNIPQAARKRRGSDSLSDQIETILEVQSKGGASGVFHGISEEDLQTFMRHPNTMFASDSSVRRLDEGVPHPRGYGNNARVLGRYVRELGVLRLEDAVRRMTSLPATTFRLKHRGLVSEGHWADLVVFDPSKIQDGATFESPHRYASGLAHVFVNGQEVIRADAHTGARPGRALRRGAE